MSIYGRLEKVVAGKWIAGEGIDDAIATAKRLNGNRAGAMINYLGEDFHNLTHAEDATYTYNSLIDYASGKHTNFSISVKLTQLGLCIDKKKAEENYTEIVSTAKEHDVFVWLDMEKYNYIDDTISIYENQIKRGNVGICIQSYLKRSREDIRMLVKKKGVIRLVKGAYIEKADISYRNKASVTKNYSELMGYLFRNSKAFTLATHDETLIQEALTLKARYKPDVSFAMLNGIRNNYAFNLAKTEKVSIYVPFGRRWISYSLRRLRESSNFWLVVQSILTPNS